MDKKSTNKLLIWIKAIRAPFFTATIISGVLGGISAWYHTGSFNWVYFLLTLLGIILLNTGTNLINDYFDHTSSLDDINRELTKFSGGSRVIQDGLISAKKILLVGLAAFVLASLIGLYLNYRLKGNVILVIGVIGVFLGYFYTAEPFRLGYTPLSEIVAGFCCGPLIIVGSYYVQAQAISWNIVYISIPVGLLVSLILLINEFPDYNADRAVGKNTIVVLLGKEKAVKIYYSLMLIVYLITIYGVVAGLMPVFALLVLLNVPLCVRAIRIALRSYNNTHELLTANMATINLHLSFGAIFSMSFALSRIFGI